MTGVRLIRIVVLMLILTASVAWYSEPPVVTGLVARPGDGLVVLNWDSFERANTEGWTVSRSEQPGTPFRPLTPQPLARGGFVDFDVTNGSTYFYRVQAVGSDNRLGAAGETVSSTAAAFANDDALLELLQATAFDYFWREANPTNGLIRDRNTPTSPCSIAAVGFGLSAIAIGVDHGWITRAEGRDRVLTTLQTLTRGAQGPLATGVMGHRGWFYHFIDMRTGHRFWRCELSSIDTALLLAGVIDVREYFRSEDPAEREVRRLATRLLGRVDWRWMTDGAASLTMGWKPESGFLRSRWVGYNEAMILYVLGLGALKSESESAGKAQATGGAGRPLGADSWQAWTAGYTWRTNQGFAYVPFEPLFGHQYSHGWIDFRGIADSWMRGQGIDYFENSRRATLAQQAYCAQNPGGFKDYSADIWGITACDGPKGYGARGAPPAFHDDGTLAPTAVGGSMPFAPTACLATLKAFHQRYRRELWTAYGFRDAFNPTVNWWGPDVLGIDQGILLIMIENHRTERVWKRFRNAPEIRRGLEQAGFAPR